MKQRLINYLLKYVVKVTIPEDVIRESEGKLYLGKLPITPEETRSLVAEAKALEKMRIWSIMNETVKQSAYERGWLNSKDIQELNTAKTEYRVLDVQSSIIRKIKSKAT